MTDDLSSHSHRHLRFADDTYIWHTHEHECPGDDEHFNRLHHHAPVEHAGYTLEELDRIDRVAAREQVWREEWRPS